MAYCYLGRVKESLEASKVLFNNQKWSFFATEHLIAQGYKKIYHRAGHKNLCVLHERIEGFLKALRKHKFQKENFKIIETGLLGKEGIEIIEDLIYKHDLPNAFYCENDLVAIGAIKKLKHNGHRIPEDIAIMGFTETRMAKLVTPSLSSVKQPTFEMCNPAVKLILKQMTTNPFDLSGTEHQKISIGDVSNLVNLLFPMKIVGW